MNDEVNEDNLTVESRSSIDDDDLLDDKAVLGRMLEESLARLVKKGGVTPEYAASIIGYEQ